VSFRVEPEPKGHRCSNCNPQLTREWRQVPVLLRAETGNKHVQKSGAPGIRQWSGAGAVGGAVTQSSSVTWKNRDCGATGQGLHVSLYSPLQKVYRQVV
jgi:hypothetical protein